MAVAWRTSSGRDRRPKPVPRKVVWICTASGGRPDSSVATPCARGGFCVPAQTSARSGVTCAVQFIGSMQA